MPKGEKDAEVVEERAELLTRWKPALLNVGGPGGGDTNRGGGGETPYWYDEVGELTSRLVRGSPSLSARN